MNFILLAWLLRSMGDDAARMQEGLERSVDEGEEEAGRGKEEEGGGGVCKMWRKIAAIHSVFGGQHSSD